LQPIIAPKFAYPSKTHDGILSKKKTPTFINTGFQVLSFIPSHSSQSDNENGKGKIKVTFASIWKQCNTSDTVGQDIASQGSGPGISKNGYKKELAP